MSKTPETPQAVPRELTQEQGELREAALQLIWSMERFVRDVRPDENLAVYGVKVLPDGTGTIVHGQPEENRTPQEIVDQAMAAFDAYEKCSGGITLHYTRAHLEGLSIQVFRVAARNEESRVLREQARRLLQDKQSVAPTDPPSQ